MSKKKSNEQNRQNATIKENPKYKTYLYYFFFFLLGTLVNVSEYLEKISKIPSAYQEFKKTYIYDESFLSGNWSNDTEYIVNSGDIKFETTQTNIAMILNADSNGAIQGEILFDTLCNSELDTFTMWPISIESKEPSFLNLFMDRIFYIKTIQSGYSKTLAEFKLVEENRKEGIIKLKKITNTTNFIPEYIHLIKNLPKFDESWQELENSCSKSHEKTLLKLIKATGNTILQK